MCCWAQWIVTPLPPLPTTRAWCGQHASDVRPEHPCTNFEYPCARSLHRFDDSGLWEGVRLAWGPCTWRSRLETGPTAYPVCLSIGAVSRVTDLRSGREGVLQEGGGSLERQGNGVTEVREGSGWVNITARPPHWQPSTLRHHCSRRKHPT